MNPESALTKTATINFAITLKATGVLPKKEFLELMLPIGFHDYIGNRHDSILKLCLIELLKIYVKDNKLKHIGTSLINKSHIHANIFQYEWEAGGERFCCLSLSKNGVGPHPLFALTESIFAYTVKDGCEQCGFDEDGCEQCGYNKARRVIQKTDGITSFNASCQPFWDMLGESVSEAVKSLSEQVNSFMKEAKEEMEEYDSKPTMDDDEWDEDDDDEDDDEDEDEEDEDDEDDDDEDEDLLKIVDEEGLRDILLDGWDKDE